jgi:lysozyme family protein
VIDIIINFIKSLFIKDKEEPTMEALHNISIPSDTRFRVVDDAGVDIETGKYVGDSGIQEEIEDMPVLDTFEEIIDKVIEHEGGYVNDPQDPGGETKYGIAKNSNPDVDIKNLTVDGAKKIYWEKYWVPNKVDKVPSQLKYIYYDMCVNMGRGNAVKVLQRAANQKGNTIAVDGGIGPNTLKAIKNLEVERARAFRVKYYADLCTAKPDLLKFYFGWFRRSLEV